MVFWEQGCLFLLHIIKCDYIAWSNACFQRPSTNNFERLHGLTKLQDYLARRNTLTPSVQLGKIGSIHLLSPGQMPTLFNGCHIKTIPEPPNKNLMKTPFLD